MVRPSLTLTLGFSSTETHDSKEAGAPFPSLRWSVLGTHVSPRLSRVMLRGWAWVMALQGRPVAEWVWVKLMVDDQ